HVSYGSADGFSEPKHITDRAGNRMVMDMYFSHEESAWISTGNAHCTSAAAFDWDNDGDFDLLLGDYSEGRLMLRTNTGSNAEPSFATENTPVTIGDTPFLVPTGMSAPHLVDWDGDGLTDILAGGMQEGSVYFYRNTGAEDAPAFAPPVTLLKPEGMPKVKTEPNSGAYVSAHDMDGDGDLDLLVGGYAVWSPEREPLNEEETARLEALWAEQMALSEKVDAEFNKIAEQAGADGEKLAELINTVWQENQVVQQAMQRMQEIRPEIAELEGEPLREAGVWMYERK
ncbi:MAG: FG-GAP-like repeat-containing protein, partial [Planctomycetota bacterium]